MGEYDHEVLVDGEHEVRRVVGCDIRAVPVLDADLRSVKPTIHIQNSHVANLNLGSQVGTINVALQSISEHADTQKEEFVRAVEQLTQAVASHATLPDADKQEILQALSAVAEGAAKKPAERSKGILKAAVAWLPTAIRNWTT